MTPTLFETVAARDAALADPGSDASRLATRGDDYLRVPEPEFLRLDDSLGFRLDPTVNGGFGDDTLYGAEFIEVVGLGGPDDDVLIARDVDGPLEWEVTLNGGPGDDTFHAGSGVFAYLQGGPGSDVYHLLPGPSGGAARARVFDQGDYWFPASVREAERENPGFDVVYQYGRVAGGISGAERIVAIPGAGDMNLRGGTSDDTEFVGNEGDNLIFSLGGNDTMTGGGGADEFRLIGSGTVQNEVTITDFDGDDVIVLDVAYFADYIVDSSIPPRPVEAAELQLALGLGLVAYDRESGVGTIDSELDGEADFVLRLTPGTALQLDDLLLS